jgi:hypothetical protein
VNVYGTLGLSQLVSDVKSGSMQPRGLAPGFGADFSYFFAEHWGVAAGAEVAFFSVQLFTANIGMEQPAVATTSYLHKQTDRLSATYLRVPLWLRFRTPLGRHEFRAGVGGSFDIALSGRRRTETEWRTSTGTGTSTSTETINTSGALHCFGHGVSLAAEAGLRWKLNEHWGLYTGVYGSYGLSNVFTGSDDLPAIDNIHLFAVGLKVGVAFGW